jgi:hypothetical protein
MIVGYATSKLCCVLSRHATLHSTRDEELADDRPRRITKPTISIESSLKVDLQCLAIINNEVAHVRRYNQRRHAYGMGNL